ncbi:helix-turn-helix domain-containing protein [Aquimarina sp. MMG016]|uniref:helix-turn-helix domain-containing protein n=1 Tax=Aquimarina sp. MMG016 TaxID=2822690 RepID=UPI001B3A6906|nr:helix-turn-helix domain-containing protein [Aquimarina sp. MMG016]MBQ4821939.1 AraC family transcriptional regulator [Aquimarina sp. MMG016]
MKNFKTLKEYSEATGIPLAKHEHFVVRSFQENMPTVVHKMPAFRHAFYAIALKINGEGKALASHYSEFPNGSVVFFNSPFQILSWDIAPNWEGYYILMTRDFIAQSHHFKDFLEIFPFLKIDKAIPFQVDEQETKTLLNIYEKINHEYHSDKADKFDFITTYVLLLLNHVKRYFDQEVSKETANQIIKTADLKLLSRYQELIEVHFREDNEWDYSKNLHSPSFYADILNVHPNHLNAIVKNNLGITALQYIHKHLLHLAKSYLTQTNLSIKEIAYQLQFDSPNNFNNFFKKHTQNTPGRYRKSAHI